ncbi:kinase-like domain [Fusarium albosuccineum]|uniref:Kinase-like domain n=1 Tax=Fusarium albosuccineum TaxID=1237068 RepID=A0A8H4LN22_9HYPO|nr:kinase-like domain [Fusarium albosuccineum]
MGVTPSSETELAVSIRKQGILLPGHGSSFQPIPSAPPTLTQNTLPLPSSPYLSLLNRTKMSGSPASADMVRNWHRIVNASEVVVQPQAGELYAGLRRESQEWLPVLLLPLSDLAEAGLSLVRQGIPSCLVHNVETQEFEWRSGYEDQGPFSHLRKYPACFVREFTDVRATDWVEAGDLRVLDVALSRHFPYYSSVLPVNPTHVTKLCHQALTASTRVKRFAPPIGLTSATTFIYPNTKLACSVNVIHEPVQFCRRTPTTMTDRDDEIRKLQRALEEAKKREAAARGREVAAREREELARAREESLQHDQRHTSYDEYLQLCHRDLFTTLKVQDKSKSSGGGTTDVTGKHYPLRLRPWDGFLDEQRSYHRIIEEILQNDSPLLPSRLAVRAIAQTANKRPVASEDDLRTFEHLAVEDPVEKVFAEFGPRSQSHPIGRQLDCKAITFENQPPSLTETDETDRNNDEVVFEAVPGQSGSNKRVARQRRASRRKGPDKWSHRTRHSGVVSTAFPIEYKAAHKIPVESFQKALHREDLFVRVISRISSGKVSTDGESHLQEQIEETVAKALAQTFHYMIRLGSSYGYLTAGKTLIFLQVGDDPTVLCYHMALPENAAESEDGTVDPFYTAVAQLAAFCLQTCRDSGKSDQWREEAIAVLKEWPQPYAEMCGGTTEEEASPASMHSGSLYAGSPVAAQKLTVELRRTTRPSCRDPDPLPKIDASDTSSGDDEPPVDEGGWSRDAWSSLQGSAFGSKKRKDVTPGSDGSASGEVSELEARPYCTQRCLLGLKEDGLLDEKCPNVGLHRRVKSGQSHPINATRLRELLCKKLAHPIYRPRCLKPLDRDGKYGETGALFKLTLGRYGYTFVGKGTYAAAVARLQHEAHVYSRLEPLQGHFVPVCLGSIDLKKPYHLVLANVVHMLLMSWAGTTIEMRDSTLEEKKTWLGDLLRERGVLHNDMRQANLLWNDENDRVMVVDFDLAIALPFRRNKRVSELSGKRKRHRHNSAAYVRKPFIASDIQIGGI